MRLCYITCLSFPSVLIFQVPTCLCSYVSTCLYIFLVPTCLHALSYFVPRCAHFSRSYVPATTQDLRNDTYSAADVKSDEN